MSENIDCDSAATDGYAVDLRQAFERWISGPPYELSIDRYSDDPAASAWPGQYREIRVQVAFEAWMEAAKLFQSCVAVATDGGTCRSFRTADGFRQWMMGHTESRGLVLAWVDGVSLEA